MMLRYESWKRLERLFDQSLATVPGAILMLPFLVLKQTETDTTSPTLVTAAFPPVTEPVPTSSMEPVFQSPRPLKQPLA